jgi:hypothetical protein
MEWMVIHLFLTVFAEVLVITKEDDTTSGHNKWDLM